MCGAWGHPPLDQRRIMGASAYPCLDWLFLDKCFGFIWTKNENESLNEFEVLVQNDPERTGPCWHTLNYTGIQNIIHHFLEEELGTGDWGWGGGRWAPHPTPHPPTHHHPHKCGSGSAQALPKNIQNCELNRIG